MAVSYCSSRGGFRILSQVKIGAVKYGSKGASFACRASSGSYRRNPDFPRQNKNSYRGRNRQNEERDSFDDESELLSSRNGPILSLSSSPKFQATSTPGPREKEIVELFRKVQVQLRERAAAREDKKTETIQGQRKESQTVDSLLKLLRKHSVEQGKRKSNSGSSNNFSLDRDGPNGSHVEDKSTSFFDSSSRARSECRETNASSFTRPASNFRRRSPVTQFKYQPVYSSEETENSISHLDSSGKGKKSSLGTHTDPKRESESEPELGTEPEARFTDGEVYDEASDVESNVITDGSLYDEVLESEPNILDDNAYGVSEEGASSDNDEDENKQEEIENGDLSALKCPELRALAKSRGVKGFSKMKKAELLELLTGGSV